MFDKLIGKFEAKRDKASAFLQAAMAARDMDESWINAADNPFDVTGTSRGQTGASGAVNLVVALMVGGLMAAFLLPIAIDEIATVDTSSWDGGAAALWNILPVIVVLAIFLFFVGVALSYTNRI